MMVFSQESSQAIFEKGNVELIEVKTSTIDCTTVFKGTLLCACGKHFRPDQEIIRCIKAAFEFLKAPYFRTSGYCKGLRTRL